MSRYIKLEDAIEAAINGCASWDGGYFPSMDEPIKEKFEAVDDKCIDVVRCKDCIYAERARVNDKGFTICEVSHMDITENDFCSYGERKDGESKDYGTTAD